MPGTCVCEVGWQSASGEHGLTSQTYSCSASQNGSCLDHFTLEIKIIKSGLGCLDMWLEINVMRVALGCLALLPDKKCAVDVGMCLPPACGEGLSGVHFHNRWGFCGSVS